MRCQGVGVVLRVTTSSVWAWPFPRPCGHHIEYQIDVGTEAGVTEYKRILAAAAKFGAEALVGAMVCWNGLSTGRHRARVPFVLRA